MGLVGMRAVEGVLVRAVYDWSRTLAFVICDDATPRRLRQLFAEAQPTRGRFCRPELSERCLDPRVGGLLHAGLELAHGGLGAGLDLCNGRLKSGGQARPKQHCAEGYAGGDHREKNELAVAARRGRAIAAQLGTDFVDVAHRRLALSWRERRLTTFWLM